MGYLEVTRLSNFLAGGDGEDRTAFLRQQLDIVIDYFNARSVDKLVVDIRRNDGGDSSYGLEIAGRFTRGKTRIAMSERRPNDSGLTAAVPLMITPSPGAKFDGEVILLTSRLTASAAEITAFAFHALPHVTVLGGPTFGVLSRTERVLPNGWTVSITAGHVEAPNGERYEAVGVPVDIEIPVFDSDDIASQVDPAIETALMLLE